SLMRTARSLKTLAIATLAFVLTACAGLPTSGPVGIEPLAGNTDTDPQITERASGPIAGAGPEAIVAGFIEAAITPADNWAIAKQFLTPELADSWRPGVGVTIDVAGSRAYGSDVESPEEAEAATTA